MKKNDWILTVAVGLYSFLFYEQSAGINFLFFNIGLISLLAIRDGSVMKRSNWWIVTFSCLLSALCIGYYGNSLSVIANIISLSLLAGISLDNKSSVVFTILYAGYSYVTSAVFIITDYADRRRNGNQAKLNNTFKKTVLVTFPILITILFFLMYRASNPLFYEFSKNLNLDFISWSWITFTLGGLILLYGFFYHRRINQIALFDESASNNISTSSNTSITFFGRQFNIYDEYFSGKILFVLLNALLLTVNALDVNFMFIDGKLPVGVTYSEFVHQGIGMLITSILVAIAIILFYFRGELNFYEKSKAIKYLAYLWILQNAFMLASTAFRNNMYITEYGLTYKRIGVYIYLFLSLLGLCTTFIKIIKIKSNIFLFRVNGWLFYGVLILSCLFNWDMIITDFNLNVAKRVEKNYLNELSAANLPDLLMLENDTAFKNKSFVLKADENDLDVASSSESKSKRSFENQLGKRVYDFFSERAEIKWKSFYYENSKTYRELIELNNNKKIQKLTLASCRLDTLEPLHELNYLNELDLTSNRIDDLNEFHYFIHLKKLTLKQNYLNNLKGIENLKHLEYLDIAGNSIYNYSPLYDMGNLKVLHVSIDISNEQLEGLQNCLPNTTIIKG